MAEGLQQLLPPELQVIGIFDTSGIQRVCKRAVGILPGDFAQDNSSGGNTGN